jgi:hypothetical protein
MTSTISVVRSKLVFDHTGPTKINGDANCMFSQLAEMAVAGNWELASRVLGWIGIIDVTPVTAVVDLY